MHFKIPPPLWSTLFQNLPQGVLEFWMEYPIFLKALYTEVIISFVLPHCYTAWLLPTFTDLCRWLSVNNWLMHQKRCWCKLRTLLTSTCTLLFSRRSNGAGQVLLGCRCFGIDCINRCCGVPKYLCYFCKPVTSISKTLLQLYDTSDLFNTVAKNTLSCKDIK